VNSIGCASRVVLLVSGVPVRTGAGSRAEQDNARNDKGEDGESDKEEASPSLLGSAGAAHGGYLWSQPSCTAGNSLDK
jgi:hypothetical protein